MHPKHEVREFYHAHKQKIEHWLDLALCEAGDWEKLPAKVNPRKSRSHRRFAMVRFLVRMKRLADLSGSSRVLDVGAGFGDFAVLARDFKLERLDATEPTPQQYRFLTDRFPHYDNVYDLPLEEMDLSGYDTLILSGLWVPDWGVLLEELILPTVALRDVVMTISTTKDDHMVITPNSAPGTWRHSGAPEDFAIYKDHREKLYSMEIMNRIFKRHGFRTVNSQTYGGESPWVWLHLRRD